MEEAPACPTLPSSETAYRFLCGDPAAAPLLLRDWVLRSSLIGIGLYAAGEREFGSWAKKSLAGGASIEAFVLAWVYWNSVRGRTPCPPCASITHAPR